MNTQLANKVTTNTVGNLMHMFFNNVSVPDQVGIVYVGMICVAGVTISLIQNGYSFSISKEGATFTAPHTA